MVIPLLLLVVEILDVVVVTVMLAVLLLLVAVELVAVVDAVVPVLLLTVEAGAPGSLSMVPSALLTFDPRLF